MTKRRLRMVAVVLQPQFMIDDGEYLIPVKVDSITVPAADWHQVVEMLASAVEQLRQQVEDPPD
jgi:hypothetical protein